MLDKETHIHVHVHIHPEPDCDPEITDPEFLQSLNELVSLSKSLADIVP